MAALDWSQCPAVESIPGKVSGAWVFRGTHTPAAVVFENTPCYSPRGMEDERRRDERLRILGNLQGDVTIVQPVRVMDVSINGASLEIERALAIESLHDFRLPIGEMSVVVKARVAYCRISDIWPDHVVYRAGVEFVDVLPHVHEAIAEHIRDIRAARQQT